MSRRVVLGGALFLIALVTFAPHFGPALFGYSEAAWLFYLVGSPLLFVILALSVFFLSNKNRWSLLLWLLAPICFWYPGQLLVMLLIWTLRGGMV